MPHPLPLIGPRLLLPASRVNRNDGGASKKRKEDMGREQGHIERRGRKRVRRTTRKILKKRLPGGRDFAPAP